MKRSILSVMLMSIALLSWAQESPKSDYVSDQILRQKVVDNGGSGDYRAVVVTEKSLENFTIYRPRSIKAAARKEGPLPVLIWCNGACVDSSQDYQRMLTEIASHGYLVVAIGKMMINKGDREEGGSSEQQVVEAINWVVNQANTKTSDYYKAINVNNMAASGHSCGGAQAIANCGNARIKTLLIMNAGMGGMSMGGASPQTLQQLHCPLIYMTGGSGDVAYGNAQTDFNSISKVPVVWADLPTAGHGGTYWDPKGGEFGKIAIHWMDWQLKGYTQHADEFLKTAQTTFPQWNIQCHNFGEVNYDDLYEPGLTMEEEAFDRQAAEETFAFGADVSMLTTLTQQGVTFCNRQGTTMEVMPILKEEGMNSVRLSLLVNPSDDVCGLAYARALANKAKAEDMNVMLTLHYADNRTDIGTQQKPASWKDCTTDELAAKVRSHSRAYVGAFTSKGVKVKWVQVGYQLDDGMLWPDGRLKSDAMEADKFALLFNSAYDAIKGVDPDIQVVLHVADLPNTDNLKTYLDALQEAGVKWDILGLSAFPHMSGLTPDAVIKRTIDDVNCVKQRYEKPVMVVETGHYNNQPLESNNFLSDFLKKLLEAGAVGCFYKEPEMTDNYVLGAWNPNTRCVSIALDAFKGVKHLDAAHSLSIAWNIDPNPIFDSRETILFPVTAKHLLDHIEKVDLMEGTRVKATSTEAPYTLAWENPAPGVYDLHARATDTDGDIARTDTVSVVVGPAAIMTGSPVETIDGTMTRTWEMDFKQTGQYLLVLKYKSDAKQYVKMYFNGNQSSFFLNVTKGEKYGYKTKKYTVEATGKAVVTLTASGNYTLPDVEQAMFIPLEGQSLDEGDGTGVNALSAQNAVRLKKDKNHLSVESASPLRHIRVFNMSGMLLAEKTLKGNRHASLPIDGQRTTTLLIVQVETDAGTQTIHIRM